MTLLGVVLALLALLVAGLLRSHAEILRALHELGANLDPARSDDAPPSPAGGRTVRSAEVAARPPRRAVDVSGITPGQDTIAIAVSGARHLTLLAFLTSGCTTCHGFWDSWRDGGPVEVPGDARLVIVTKDPDTESIASIKKLAPRTVPVVMSSDAWEAYDVPVAPYFVYVDGPSGQVLGEGAASTWEQVVSLLSQALDDAGLESGGSSRRHRRRRSRGDAPREARADRDLLAAGIHPGHPSLFPRSEDDLRQEHGHAEGQGEAHEP